MTETYDQLGGQRGSYPAKRRAKPKYKPRAPQYSGCAHTDDENGWVTDPETGRVTGKCECWELIE